MNISLRDRLASAAVAVATAFAVAWFADVAGIGSLDVRVATLIVLGIGVGVSASAVVPGFADLIRGSRMYLAVTSALGFAAFAAALATLVNATPATLGVVVVLLVVLWAIATLRHAGALVAPRPRPLH